MNLPERLLAIDASLTAHGMEHAFGGAIALAYWTQDPRGTSDIDVNIFVGTERAAEAVAALPDGVQFDDAALAAIERDGQARLWWEGTPIDVFLDYADIHADAARHRRTVPFSGAEIPILGPIELAVFKAMFDRTRDWADIEAMLAAETLDVDAVQTRLAEMLEPSDERFARLREAAERAAAGD